MDHDDWTRASGRAGAERRGGINRGTRREEGAARTEEAELAGVDLDEHVLAAHRRRQPARPREREPRRTGRDRNSNARSLGGDGGKLCVRGVRVSCWSVSGGRKRVDAG
jgi:hypothetical protein